MIGALGLGTVRCGSPKSSFSLQSRRAPKSSVVTQQVLQTTKFERNAPSFSLPTLFKEICLMPCIQALLIGFSLARKSVSVSRTLGLCLFAS